MGQERGRDGTGRGWVGGVGPRTGTGLDGYGGGCLEGRVGTERVRERGRDTTGKVNG